MLTITGLPPTVTMCGVANPLRKSPSAFWLSVRTEILEIDRPRRPPHGLSSVLVERHDVLMIAAIEVHQQQIPEQNR